MTAVAEAPQRRALHMIQRHADQVRGDRVLQVSLALIGAQLALRAWATYGGWFVLDDFNFIARMGHDGLDPYSASRSYLGHVMPGAMYLSWFNHVVAPWQWWLPATELLVMQAGADLAMLRLLMALSGRRPGILPPLALFLFSVISIEGGIWWAAAINLLPMEIALFMAMAAHLKYLRTGRLSHAVGANSWIAAGLLFNEKSALIYLAVAVFTFVYFAQGYGWRRVASTVRGRTAALALYVATGAMYVAVYLSIGRGFTYGHSAGYPTYGVVRNLVLHAYVPALVGGPVRWDQFGLFSFAAPGDAIVLASAVALGLVLNELLRHRDHAARALALPVVFLIVDVVLVLLTRTVGTGPGLVLDYRFQGEMAGVTAIALACMSMPIAGAAVSSSRRSSSELLDHGGRVTALVAAITAVAILSTIGFVTTWHSDDRGRHWVQTLSGTLMAAPAPVPLVDRVVPDFVMAHLIPAEILASRLFVREENADWVSVSTDRLNAIDDAGRVLPVIIPPVRTAVAGPVAGCGYHLGSTPITIALNGPVTEDGLWLRIGYLSSGASPVRVTAGDRTVNTTIQPGLHALFVRAGSSFDSVRISGLSDPTFLCTDDVTAGVPQPYDPEGAAQP
jgi:hypothetical protein